MTTHRMRLTRVLGLCAGLALGLPAAAGAQTVTLATDLSPIIAAEGYGPIAVQRVDDDGDGVSDSWLLRSPVRFSEQDHSTPGGHTGVLWIYALARTTHGICVEPWFSPTTLTGTRPSARITVQKDGVRDVLQVQDGPWLFQMQLDRHSCLD